MKTRFHFPNNCFRNFSLFAMVLVFLGVFSSHWVSSSSAKGTGKISRGEFVSLMALHNPDHPLVPKNHLQLSPAELYVQTAKALSLQGINVLQGKPRHKPLNSSEFVRLTYAFTGGPTGKNLFDQKLYLKKAGIIETADIGITTGVEGIVYQFHEGEVTGKLVELASPIFRKDRIKTGAQAKSSFTFDDGSILTLGENSVVNITKHIYDPDKGFREMVVEVSLGAVKFLVTKAKGENSTFKVVTPAVTASVRGTEFVVIVKPDGNTNLVTLEGVIEATPLLPNGTQGKPATIAGGQTQEISNQGTASRVEQAPLTIVEEARTKTSVPRKTVKKAISFIQAEEAARATQAAAKKIAQQENAPERNNTVDIDKEIDRKNQDKKNKSKLVKNVS